MYEPPDFQIPFLYGESYRNYLLPYERIEGDAPSQSGMYGWFFRIRPEAGDEALQFLADLYQQRTLKADISGTLRLQYTGILHKTRADLSNADREILREGLVAFPIPLYIGISRNLKDRLTTHKSQLEHYLHSHPEYDQISAEIGTDTEDESKSFGQRLGTFWREHDFFGTDNLYVRYILTSDTAPRSNESTRLTFRRLQETETVLNSLINPVFGRR